MGSSKTKAGARSKSSTTRPSLTTPPSSGRSSAPSSLQNGAIEVEAHEVVTFLNNDPLTRPHVQNAVASLALQKQSEMFQQVQKQLAEAQAELARRDEQES